MAETADGFGPREGETRIELPAAFDAGLYFIGRIRTPWTDRRDCPRNGAGSQEVCTVEIDPRFAAGIAGLETCTHVWLLYFMDRAPRDLVIQRPRHYGEPRGTFALRSPARPNPIALSAVDLLKVERRDDGSAALSVRGLDCLDGTPLVDVKPYFASTDAAPAARVGWHEAFKAGTES